jgi:hypothetical protein
LPRSQASLIISRHNKLDCAGRTCREGRNVSPLWGGRPRLSAVRERFSAFRLARARAAGSAGNRNCQPIAASGACPHGQPQLCSQQLRTSRLRRASRSPAAAWSGRKSPPMCRS